MLVTKNTRVQKMLETQELLKHFGFTLFAYDPGVQGKAKGYDVNISYGEWEWLEPLLKELKDLREKCSAP